MEILYTDSDGNTIKFTEEMAKVAIAERDQLRKEVEYTVGSKDKAWEKLSQARRLVFDFFNEEYSAGETQLTFQVEDINQLLRDIGADVLKSLYTVRGTINYEVTDVEAESEEDAQEAVENYLTVEYSGEGDLNDWSVEVDRVNEQ